MSLITAVINIYKHPLNKGHFVRTTLRLIIWKINQLLFRIPVIVRIQENLKCLCYPQSSQGGLTYLLRLPDFAEINYLKSFLKPSDVFVDIGANVGTYSLIAAKCLPKGKVVAFEPVGETLKIFKKNITLNKIKNIISFKKVASNTNSGERFNISTTSEISSISTKGKKISSVKLDTCLRKLKIKNVKLIKIDVEGAELKVLQGAQKYIRENRIQSIIFEVNKKSKNLGIDPLESIDFLKKHGYIIYKFTNSRIVKMNKIKPGYKTFNALAVKKGVAVNKS